jgi:hypothetical protein
MWHNGLLYKLSKKGAPLHLLKLIREYLQGRTFVVTLDEGTSTLRTVECGIPQGSVLGPILFNLFLSDMPTPDRCFLCGYADDTTLVAQSMNCNFAIVYASRGANVLKDYFDTWQLQVNCAKTQAMLVTKKRPKKLKEVEVKGTVITRVNEMKLLGVIFDSRLNFLAEMRARRAAAYRAFSALYCLAGAFSKLSVDKKLLLYKTIFRPILTYGSPLWASLAKKGTWASFEVTQGKIVKAALGRTVRTSTTLALKDSSLPKLQEFVGVLANNFVLNCKNSQLPDIRDLYAT